MPVYKFKTFEDAEKALWVSKLDEAYYKKVAELWEFANELRPVQFPKGIFKFKNIEEANKHREKLEKNIAEKLKKNI
jgi:hypothetical protein